MKGLRQAISLDNLKIFLYVYALIRPLFNKVDKDAHMYKYTILILKILTTLILSLLVYGVTLLCAIYHEIVNIILIFRHGNNYIEIVDGTDVIWLMKDKNHGVINSLFIIDSDGKGGYRELYEFFLVAYKRMSKNHIKLHCTKEKYFGLYYLLKANVDIKDFVQLMDDYKDENELCLSIDKHSSAQLPLKNKALWKVYVGKNPIKWQGKNGQYPVLIKYNHAVGDGFAIIAMMTTYLMENGVEIMKSKCDTYKALMDSRRKREHLSVKIITMLKKIFDDELYIKFFGPVNTRQSNFLHGKPLSGDKYLCWALECEDNDYVRKVKEIKNKLREGSFTDIIITAISASVAEYFNKYDKNPPEAIRSAVTHYFSSAEYNKIVSVKDGEIVANLSNNFTIGMVNVPIKDEDIERNLINRLLAVKKDTEVLKGALDFPFLYWQLKVISTVLPVCVLMESSRTNDGTLAITNVPGNMSANLLNGYSIKDSVVFAPNFLLAGVTFSIFTFDNLFRLGVIVDKALVEDKQEVQNMVDGVFKYIDLLYEKTRNIEF